MNLKAAAKAAGKDVWFFNNGDHVEGSGLSDASVYTTGKFLILVVHESNRSKRFVVTVMCKYLFPFVVSSFLLDPKTK